MKTTIIINEKEYAQECLRSGSCGDNPYVTLQILAKYYYYEHGYRARRIEKALTEFLRENYPRYMSDVARWTETIERIARNAGKYRLYDTNEIWITRKELDTIALIQDDKNAKLRRVAFTFLCLAKLYNDRNPKNNGWVNTDAKDIFQMAHVAVSKVEQNKMIGDLVLLGLIELAKKNDNLSNRVTFVDDDGDRLLPISDFRDLGYEYLMYVGENYIRCASCGRLVKGNKAGTKKYCSDCSGYQPQETKPVVCIECGNTFTVSSKNNKSIRCPDCQRSFVKQYDRYRKSLSVNSV